MTTQLLLTIIADKKRRVANKNGDIPFIDEINDRDSLISTSFDDHLSGKIVDLHYNLQQSSSHSAPL